MGTKFLGKLKNTANENSKLLANENDFSTMERKSQAEENCHVIFQHKANMIYN